MDALQHLDAAERLERLVNEHELVIESVRGNRGDLEDNDVFPDVVMDLLDDAVGALLSLSRYHREAAPIEMVPTAGPDSRWAPEISGARAAE